VRLFGWDAAPLCLGERYASQAQRGYDERKCVDSVTKPRSLTYRHPLISLPPMSNPYDSGSASVKLYTGDGLAGALRERSAPHISKAPDSLS